ncbi:hypothetical protein ACA910_013927 [Epithemia clementina (nom. ined.)]
MSETVIDMSPKPPSLVEGTSEISEDLVFTHVMERVLNLNPTCIRILKIWMNYIGFDDFHSIFDDWALIMPDNPSTRFCSYKIGQDMHDLPNVILTRLILLTLWDLKHMRATKARVPDSLWMALTKDDFEQLSIASNHELPEDSEMTSISMDLTDDFDDCNLVSLLDLPADNASLFDLPADDEMTSIFADIADNCDNWTLASIFEPPNDDAAILPSPDPHFHAQNHTSVNSPEAYGRSHASVNLSAENREQFNACAIKNDQKNKGTIIDIDDQVFKKTIVGIENPDEDATTTIVDIENQELASLPVDVHLHDTNQCPLVDQSLELYYHGENAPTDLITTKS